MSDTAKAPPQIIQITRYRKWLVALCDDGSLWLGRDRKGRWKWRPLPEISPPASTNDLLTDMITREAVRLFRNANQFLRMTDSKPDEESTQRALSVDEYSQRILFPNDSGPPPS